jgi:hypothetical protein
MAYGGPGGGGGSVDELGCYYKKRFTSVCDGLPAEYEHDGEQYCVLHFPSKDKDLDAFTEAIQKKRNNDFRGIYFPVKHTLTPSLPVEEEIDFSSCTFEGGADFSNVTFKKYANFSNATFKEHANFSYTNFSDAGPNAALFYKATFEVGADFSSAIFNSRVDFLRTTFEGSSVFEGAGFSVATFKGVALFSNCTFEVETDFSSATFEVGATFREITFKGRTDFSEATFEGHAYFDRTTFKEEGIFSSLQTSPQTSLHFEGALIEKPESLKFHSTFLRPSWFVDVDAPKFDFTDVEWFRLPDGDELKLENEIEALEPWPEIEIEALEPRLLERRQRQRKLQKACRQLMKNAEENHDYPTANEFHYWSMELARKEAMVLAREKRFREGLRRFGLIDVLYGALSGYGVRPRRAFLVLVGMWAFFAILYMVWGGSQLRAFSAFALLQFIDFFVILFWWEPSFAILFAQAYSLEMQALSASEIQQSFEHAWKSLVYSLAAMARLNPQPKPDAPGLFQFLVTAEGILGPLQIALLALAVRRRVMR